ncbi:MAG: UDP-N-acetylmuramoyl-tripeptide--D-alanyl-D-alanine ligase, partial [Bacilli bacterium]|nr:UDP-N-acetylmuramoyl-tripeptide--D-alanyl-D-alanine ligase [Bacilli bacterium]
ILSLFPWFLYTAIRTRKALHMLQQNLYNRNQRYIKWLMNNVNKYISIYDLIPFLVIILSIYTSYNITLISFSIIYFIIFIISYRKLKGEQYKKPLVVTPRIKRLIITLILLYSLPFYSILLEPDDLIFNYSYLIILSFLQYFMMLLAVIINKPIEKCVYYYFRGKATKKLKQMFSLIVIGVTGSYGKTSSKNILSEILNIKYNAFASPRNLNTPYGLMNTINDYMDKFTEIFIAEMGAYKVGEIKELCDLVKPKYGILTRIGEAHLESFGSQENIIKTKFELVENLPKDGLAVLNGDDAFQLDYKIKNKCNTIWIGIDNKDVDVKATNIEISSKGTSFEVIFKGDKQKYKFETKLLGYANIYNILAGIALGNELGISKEQLIKAVRLIKPIEHRLELKNMGNIYIIDDAYNSNPVGAEMAVNVLGMMPGKRIIVTPGMIELGPKQYEYNKQFGKQMASVCDIVILIGEEQTKPIQDGLKEENYNKDKIYVLNDIKKAFDIINTIKEKDTYVLLENDLPDIFSEE